MLTPTLRIAATTALMGTILWACAPRGGAPAFDTEPSTLQDAERQLTLAQAELQRTPNDPELLAHIDMLRERVDALNGLVDRIEIQANHFIDFYGSDDHGVLVAERTPAGVEPVLTGTPLAHASFREIYEALAPGRHFPAELTRTDAETSSEISVDPEPVQPLSGGTPAEQTSPREIHEEVASFSQALTSNEGKYFRDHYCNRAPESAVFKFCLLRYSKAYASYRATHSVVWVAPYSGNFVQVRPIINGNLKGVLPVFKGEVARFYWTGPKRSVFFGWKKVRIRWEVGNGGRFHFGGYYESITGF